MEKAQNGRGWNDDGTAYTVDTHATQGVAHVVGALACNTGPNGHDAGNFACNQAVDAGHVLPMAFQQTADCLTAAYGTKWNGNASATNGSLFAAQSIGCFKGGQGSAAGGIGYDEHIAPTLSAADSGSNRTPALMQGMAVRRLTPVECERLQGFPDNYTNIPWRKKDESPDGPRYKALGNSWAVPVVRWIGQRIKEAVQC
jgi:site-specific DNA-cytosine methylase